MRCPTHPPGTTFRFSSLAQAFPESSFRCALFRKKGIAPGLEDNWVVAAGVIKMHVPDRWGTLVFSERRSAGKR